MATPHFLTRFRVAAKRDQNGEGSPRGAGALGAQAYQVVLILKGVVQRRDPLAVTIHQHITLFSKASCL